LQILGSSREPWVYHRDQTLPAAHSSRSLALEPALSGTSVALNVILPSLLWIKGFSANTTTSWSWSLALLSVRSLN
jgi:hypothetical protein